MLVRTMGLFWKCDEVFWGKQKNPGAIYGVASASKKTGEVDFWDQVGVYALYSDFRLIYIGQSGAGQQRLGVRLRQHTKDDLAGRWDTFSWFGIRFVKNDNSLGSVPLVKQAYTSAILNVIEGVLIEVAEPPLNRQRGRFGTDVERYLQYRDSRLDGD